MELEEFIGQSYSRKSIKRYAQAIQHYLTALGLQAEQATYSDVVEYIGLLRLQGKHPKTLRNILFAIKIYYRYLVSIGKRADHPCQTLYLKDQINRSIAVEDLYSKESLEELYENFSYPKDRRHESRRRPEKLQEAIKKRDKILLSLLIYQALTTTEIIYLKVEDIDLKNGTVAIKKPVYPTRRTNKERTLSLHPKQILLFQTYLKTERKIIWRMAKRGKRKDYFVLGENGLQLSLTYMNRMLSKGRSPEERFTPMKIRQSVIAHLLKEKNDVRVVQVFAGHRRTASTEAYAQTGLEALKIAIDQLHPLQ